MRVHLSFDGMTTEELRYLAAIGVTEYKVRPIVKCEGPRRWSVEMEHPVTLTGAMQLTRELWSKTLVEEDTDGS